MSCRIWLLALSLGVLGACATPPDGDPRDPFEGFNRGVAKFNDEVDAAILRPIATTYQEVVPKLARTGVSNFFNNLQDVWTAVNSGLQLKGQAAAESVVRVGVNTVFGIFGLFDVASEMRIERHREDFGQTLGRWGVPPGPYLVLPILGPSSLRDTVALPVDWSGNALLRMNDVSTRNWLAVLDRLDTRARLLGVGSLVEEAALEKYSFVRDVYLQRRNSDVFDGRDPAEPEPKK